MTCISVERNEASADFFAAAGRGELLLHRCAGCGAVRIARRTTCRACGSQNATWTTAAGTGCLVTWGRHPGGGAGWLFGIVELAEGPWLETTLTGFTAHPRQGEPVCVTFVSGDEGETYPAFAPDEQKGMGDDARQ